MAQWRAASRSNLAAFRSLEDLLLRVRTPDNAQVVDDWLLQVRGLIDESGKDPEDDQKSAETLTERLRQVRPVDPLPRW